ncbi:hypothetical protein [Kitasatospora sp. CB01950]|uniref:hypothetical protein n=1 Tax=Kitasatospora sp. CB01950 TaxID=1703930 RepID=UPI00093F7ADB|nr:hypothetical protein [Kitasatospora sp. CB01950]OKI99164.1 hypothetical protein AMK19_31790 [Kitasatospora sp. CB01950]
MRPLQRQRRPDRRPVRLARRLAHYVTEHAVRLPAEFVSRAVRRLDDLEQAEADMAWWNRAGRRNG